jgi:fumarate reductase flavoprotein subunit
MREFDFETDVIVVGGGACGLTAAIAAHDAGARVAIVEKLPRPGGNTALSTGSIAGAGTRFQRAAGIDDSPARMLDDLERLAGPHDVPNVARRLAETSASIVEWLVDTVGARLRLIAEYRHIGHSVPRLHAPESRRGQDLFDDLLRAIEKRDIPFALASPVTALLRDESHRLIGVTTHAASATGNRIAAHKIILACNGFAADRDLVREYCPDITGAAYFGSPGSTGEAVRWGRELGAGLANMGAYQAYAAIAYPHGSLLSWTTIEKGGLLINQLGERFGNEAEGYSGFARRVLTQTGPVYSLFDSRIRDIAAGEDEFRELMRYGGVLEASSVGGLAGAAGLEPNKLAATIDRYNAAAQGMETDVFGRSEFGLAPLEPPFVLCRVIPGLFHTQGGLRTDADGRVLAVSGAPIPNLFAGGGAAAGISGRSGPGGYASGNGLLCAIGLGWLAGRAAAAEL